MEFQSLVLIERDNEGHFVRELSSYKINPGAVYAKKFYMQNDKVYLEFHTDKDVEEWEYTAIYDLFDIEAFEKAGLDVEELDDEYNPTWKVCFDFYEDHLEMEEKLNSILDLVEDKIEEVLQNIKGKEEQYQ